MSRQIKVATREYGELLLELIRTENDVWEPEWEPLRGTIFGAQFSVVSRAALDHCLKGWSNPLSRELGVPPEGCLKKIPKVSRQCHRKDVCPLYDSKTCFPEAKNMPWCFEPYGVANEDVRYAAMRAIDRWRNRVYLVVIREST